MVVQERRLVHGVEEQVLVLLKVLGFIHALKRKTRAHLVEELGLFNAQTVDFKGEHKGVSTYDNRWFHYEDIIKLRMSHVETQPFYVRTCRILCRAIIIFTK
jgi:hypothetical protein